MDDFKDERFKHVIKDPRFRKIPSKHTKAKLDKRIRGMFSDKRFNVGTKIDKRGFPLITKDHRKFYQLGGDQEESESSGEDENSAEDVDEESGGDLPTEKSPHANGSDEEDGSTSTDTDFTDSEQEEEIDHRWQELDADAPRGENITRRLAVCNMDWDRLRAEDFLVVFNSFKPSDGVIHSIKIYPSEFGLERMEKEKLHGPVELINDAMDSTEDKVTNGAQDSHFHREKLREYQLNRLKYYFAVVDCDSPQTADALYGELNGMEFESSGCILDLRFIPDDMTFNQEPISVTSSIPRPEDYKPTHFITAALNQIKVDLTWDETDPRRKQVLEKAFADPESIEKDLKEYLASPSESEDETEELEDNTNSKKLSSKEAIAKYKALIQTMEEKEKEQENEEFDMEITWDSGLKEKTEQLVKEKSLKETLTPFEEKLQKRKELKKLKKETKTTLEKDDDFSSSEEFGSGDITDELQEKVRGAFKGRKKNKVKFEADPEADEKKLAELALLVAEPDDKDSSDSDDENNEKKKRKKKKKKKAADQMKEDSIQEYVDDPRFAAIYTNPLYHIDPSEQNFKEKKATQAFINAVQRKKYGDSNSAVIPSESLKRETDIVKDSKEKEKKSIKVEALKEKLTLFCKEFQKTKKSQKIEKQNQSLQEEGHFSVMNKNLSGCVLEASSSKKQKKKKQKAEKQKFREVNIEDEMSTTSGTLNSSASCYLEDNDDSDILIFSGNSTKKRLSSFSSDSSHTNSVRKKMKKNHVS